MDIFGVLLDEFFTATTSESSLELIDFHFFMYTEFVPVVKELKADLNNNHEFK